MLIWFDWPSSISAMKITHPGWPPGLGGEGRTGGQSQTALIHSSLVGVNLAEVSRLTRQSHDPLKYKNK